MTITHRGLKVAVKFMGQANAVGPTSIRGTFLVVLCDCLLYLCDQYPLLVCNLCNVFVGITAVLNSSVANDGC